MAMHNYTRNQVSQVRNKKLKKRLKETLMRKKEKDKLGSLAESSLMA